MSSLRSRLGALLVGAIAILVPLVAVPASAEAPVDVVTGASDGVYVAPGRDYDAEELRAVVERAQASGITMLIAAPADPQPDAAAFALRLRQLAEIDVALVFGLEGEVKGSVSDDYFDGFARAEKAAAAATTPAQAADDFFGELLEQPPGGLPDIVKDVARWVMILAVVVALASAAEMALRSRQRTEAADADVNA